MIYVRFTSCMQSTNSLRMRSCSLNFYQNASKSALKSIKEDIFPPKPKKPLTSFLLFTKEVRSKFLKENPSLKQSEIVKKASKEWAELDPNEKESYLKEYKKNYEIYSQELEQYYKSITDEQRQLWEEKKKEHSENVKILNIKQKSKAFGKPKKPLTGFFAYLVKIKAERDPNTSFGEWIKSVSKRWNEMSETEKKPYIDQATESNVQYRKDLIEWEMKMIKLGHTDVVRRETLAKQERMQNE